MFPWGWVNKRLSDWFLNWSLQIGSFMSSYVNLVAFSMEYNLQWTEELGNDYPSWYLYQCLKGLLHDFLVFSPLIRAKLSSCLLIRFSLGVIIILIVSLLVGYRFFLTHITHCHWIALQQPGSTQSTDFYFTLLSEGFLPDDKLIKLARRSQPNNYRQCN